MGEFSFPGGYYYYIGSAQQRLKSRLKRHLRKDKKLRWHVDYLLAQGQVSDYFSWPAGKNAECQLAHFFINSLSGEIIAPGFGASDCNCETHLLYFKDHLARNLLPEKLGKRSGDNAG